MPSILHCFPYVCPLPRNCIVPSHCRQSSSHISSLASAMRLALASGLLIDIMKAGGWKHLRDWACSLAPPPARESMRKTRWSRGRMRNTSYKSTQPGSPGPASCKQMSERSQPQQNHPATPRLIQPPSATLWIHGKKRICCFKLPSFGVICYTTVLWQ